jgi:hypothetical protein
MSLLDRLSAPQTLEQKLQQQMYGGQAPIVERSEYSRNLPPAPAQAPVQKPSFFQSARAKLADPAYRAQLASAFNTMRMNPDPSVSQRASDIRAEQLAAAKANQTVDYLKGIGREDLATMVEQQPTLAADVFKSLLSSQSKTPSYGTTPHYYMKDGKPVPYQISSAGGIMELPLPEGADPVTGTTVAAEKKFTELELNLLTEKEAQATEAIDVMGRQLDAINDALLNPEIMSAIKSKVGPVQGRFPAITEQQTLGESYVENFAAKSFMRAFQMLKGGGQITEREGAAAAAAIDRLQKFTLSDEGYVKAMEDARDELQELVDIAEARKYALSKQLEPYRERMRATIGGQ